MKIARLLVQNFRSFGPAPVQIDLNPVTVLLGGNAAGKTAALLALARLFGPGQAIRSLQKSDFHVPVGKTHEEVGEISLVIDALFVAETDGAGHEEELAATWSQIFLPDADGHLFARARLQATWRPAAGHPEGEIDFDLEWITTTEDAIADEHRRRMHPQDRAAIQVHYIPGARDPARQLRNVSGTMLHRLFRALSWSDGAKQAIAQAAGSVHGALSREHGVALFESSLKAGWAALHAGRPSESPSFRFLGTTLEEVLSAVTMHFAPAPGGGEFELDRLSDGQASLLYFALVAAVFDFEGVLIDAQESTDPATLAHATAASLDELAPPVLTVFAVEEPESHLAPHYLGPIYATLERFASTRRAQTVVASHAPTLLARVDPANVRHLKLTSSRETEVRRLKLPADVDEAFKFIKEAVRAHPELYFGRVVVLGEGDSEEVVLPRLLRAHGLDLDKSLLSVVPLAGRFVHHFWRLLGDLGIAHVTLLDLDWDRYGGGWGRIKYACKQLTVRGVDWASLSLGLPTEASAMATPPDLERLHTWTDWTIVAPWLARLEEHDVFFSTPLDLDFSMMSALPAEYQAVAAPFAIPQQAPERADLLESARRSVLKASGGTLNTGYASGDDELFAWYDHLFLKRGKPVVHMLALEGVDHPTLRTTAPSELNRLVARVSALVK